LAPFFLLQAAHKVLEHLIRKYSVHAYDVTEVMQCILPYHETKVFVKLLSLLKIKTNKTFAFLEQCQAHRIAPTRSFLSSAMLKNRKFFAFVAKLPGAYTSTQSSFKSLYSFFSATMVQTILKESPIPQTLIADLIPVLTEGISSKESEFQISSYMILGTLVTQVTLRHDIIEDLEKRIISNVLPHLHRNAIFILLVTRQNSTSEPVFPQEFITMASWNDFIPTLLAFVNEQYDLSKLMVPYLDLLAKKCTRDWCGEALRCHLINRP